MKFKPLATAGLTFVILTAVVGAQSDAATAAEPATDTGPADSGTVNPSPTASSSADWRRFGGPQANFQVATTGLASSWPPAGPPLVWSMALGGGYSGIAADDGALYTLYRDGNDDVVLAAQVEDGKKLWSRRYSSPSREGHLTQFGTGPHSTPLVLDDRIVTLSYSGVLQALARSDGEVLWSWQLLDDFGGELSTWGYSASPIFHAGKVIALVGGQAQGAVAFDPADGRVIWKSPPSRVSFASPIVVEVEGQELLLYYSADGLIAIDPSDGSAEWKFPLKNGYENHSSMPVWGQDENLWVVSQMESGGRMLRPRRQAEGWKVEELWKNPKAALHYWNSLWLGDTIYAAIGSGAVLSAIDAQTGTILWRQRGFSQANLLHTPQGTLALDQEGQLSWLALSREGVEVRSSFQAQPGRSWTAPTLIGTRLLLRDEENLRAYELGRPAAAKADD